ncbi:PRC-barrel domain-containing protein [Sulfitobacter sp. HNIBRBA2951]|uniref:PRC-barrel domain-containing protein n=1 Tax=Sulfitobacter aquimarinus TaxID=3158557 RepID=UPI0032DF8936
MKTFLATTATALVLGTSAYADAHTSAFSETTFDSAINLNASEVIGMRVYASEADIQGETVTMDGQKEWDDIGEINEILLTRSGEVQSVIVGVGGFLGIGEKDVSVAMDQLQFVTEEGEIDNYFIVIKASAAGVEEAPSYESSQMKAPMADDKEAMADEKEVMADDKEAMADDTKEMEANEAATDKAPATPMTEREGYMTVSSDDLNTEDLTGARIYSSNDEDIGEISELLVTDNGKLDRAIIDVGGFIGLGEKSVAVKMDELQILRQDDGGDIRVYIDATEEALEKMPEYEG